MGKHSSASELRVAEALPRFADALESGALSWCAARELTRVACPETEPAWLDAARGKTLRELEMLVASKAPGDAPDAPATELPRRRVLRFEVAADTFATFREAVQRLQRSAGGSLDDDAVLLAMARHVLGGPRDDGRSSYQIALSVCAACGGGAQPAAGELVPVDTAVVAMAACDAQHLGELLPLAAAPRAANEKAISSADAQGRQRAVDPRGDERSPTPRRSGHAHVGAGVRPNPRAKQGIPSALRRAALTRDRRRCRAPGCTHATFVDVHHVQLHVEGGRNEASNLLNFCGAHHRAVHRGELLLDRASDGAFVFRHADGAAYGNPTAPSLIDAHAKVFSPLRQLGFREGAVKAVLSELALTPGSTARASNACFARRSVGSGERAGKRSSSISERGAALPVRTPEAHRCAPLLGIGLSRPRRHLGSPALPGYAHWAFFIEAIQTTKLGALLIGQRKLFWGEAGHEQRAPPRLDFPEHDSALVRWSSPTPS